MRRLTALLICLAWLCNPTYGHDHIYIAQRNMPAIVQVNVLDKDGTTSSATGFIVNSEGLIVTNRHVLQNALYANVTFSNGVTSGQAVILAQAPTLDLALLKIEALNLPHVILAKDDNVLVGQTITVIGNPRRLQNTVTSGIISQLRKQQDGTLWHQISAPISPSSSGSPVFNEKGEVISVAFASISGEGNQNLNFAIPIQYVKELAATQGVSVAEAFPDTQYSFTQHIKKSWEILKRLLRRWFGSPEN